MENANAKANISVWWDIETCQIPTNNFDDIYYIAKNIRLALSNANLHGKLSISAYGNTNLIVSWVQHALSTADIPLMSRPHWRYLLIHSFIITFYEPLRIYNGVFI